MVIVRRGVLAAALLGLIASGLTGPGARAADWPSQPIRMIVPFAAGTSDTIARLVGQEMAKALGQPVVVENRAGAGGNIGSEACAKARPDGYTICLGTISSHAINPAIYPRMPYDVARDFAPITQLAAQPNALAVSQSHPARTVPELIAALKANPRGGTFATSGVGTSIHLAGALFSQMAGVELEHVPYRGSGQVTTALLTGEVPIAFDNFSSVLPFHRDDKLRILGVTSAQRSETAPEIPTIAETLPGFESLSWHGLFAPAGTPAPVIERLQREAAAALAAPTVAARFRELGITAVGSQPAEFGRFVAEETRRWGEVARRAEIRVE